MPENTRLVRSFPSNPIHILTVVSFGLFARIGYAQSHQPIPSIVIDGQSSNYTVIDGETVLLDGSGSYDPDAGDIVKHDWYLNASPTYDLRGDSVYTAFWVDSSGTDQTVRLIIKDDQEQYASLTVDVTVVPATPLVAREYYVRDHLGSVRATVNQDGDLISAADYYPYGSMMPGRSQVGATPVKENYTGHEWDEETGHLYAGARYYMPGLGLWSAVDPLASLYPGQSPYMYVSGNPISRIDPTGLGDELVCRAADSGDDVSFACEYMVGPVITPYDNYLVGGIGPPESWPFFWDPTAEYQASRGGGGSPVVDKRFYDENIGEGLRYMWEMSNSGSLITDKAVLQGDVTREVAAYLLKIGDGRYGLFVFNSMPNTSAKSHNPSFDKAIGIPRFLGHELLAQVHTHPSYVRLDGTKHVPSYLGTASDRAFVAFARSSVLTITPETMAIVGQLGTRNLGPRFRAAVMGGDLNELVRQVSHYNGFLR